MRKLPTTTSPALGARRALTILELIVVVGMFITLAFMLWLGIALAMAFGADEIPRTYGLTFLIPFFITAFFPGKIGKFVVGIPAYWIWALNAYGAIEPSSAARFPVGIVVCDLPALLATTVIAAVVALVFLGGDDKEEQPESEMTPPDGRGHF